MLCHFHYYKYENFFFSISSIDLFFVDLMHSDFYMNRTTQLLENEEDRRKCWKEKLPNERIRRRYLKRYFLIFCETEKEIFE